MKRFIAKRINSISYRSKTLEFLFLTGFPESIYESFKHYAGEKVERSHMQQRNKLRRILGIEIFHDALGIFVF